MVILKDHFPGCYITHVQFLLPLVDPVPQPHLLFISSDDICSVYLEKNMTASPLSTCEGMLLKQGFCEEQSLLTEASSLPTLCQGVNSPCPCPAAPASESTTSPGRSNHWLAWLGELNCSYNKITAGLAWCLYSSFNYTAPFLIFGFWACLPKDLLVYLHCESLPQFGKQACDAALWRSQSWAMGWLHTELHQQLVAVSCLMLF